MCSEWFECLIYIIFSLFLLFCTWKNILIFRVKNKTHHQCFIFSFIIIFVDILCAIYSVFLVSFLRNLFFLRKCFALLDNFDCWSKFVWISLEMFFFWKFFSADGQFKIGQLFIWRLHAIDLNYVYDLMGCVGGGEEKNELKMTNVTVDFRIQPFN